MKVEVKIALAIPTINRGDLLKQALAVYVDAWADSSILIIDNGNQNLDVINNHTSVIIPPFNLGVSSSWNKMMDKLSELNYTHVAILNDDIIWEKNLEDIVKYIENHPADFYIGTGTWCCFVLPVATYKLVGPFDERFYPAYFEDMDYLYRLKLKDLNIHINSFFDPEVYRNSQSITKNPTLNQRFMTNKRYYNIKWGGLPGSEKYKIPFNGYKYFKIGKEYILNLLKV